MKKIFSLALFTLLFITATKVTLAATFYTSTSGSDSNSGTISSPFRTINHGASKLTPGDTLFVRAGNYTEELGEFSIPSGTGTSWSDGKMVTIKAYLGESPWMIPPSGSGRCITIDDPSRFITIDGINCDGINTQYDGIKIQSEDKHSGHPDHVIIENLEIKNSANVGLLTGRETYYVNIINIHSHNNGRVDVGNGLGIAGLGLYFKSNNGLIEGNKLHDNAGQGMQCDDDNSDQYPVCNDNIVRNNSIYNNGRLSQTRFQQGIGWHKGTNNLIYNNIVWGNPLVGIKVDQNTNTKVYNNTVYNNGVGIMSDDGGYQGHNHGILIRNNIIFGNTTATQDNSLGGTTWDHNLTTDPKFVNATSTDFSLQNNSPAINGGITLSEVPNDILGVVRPVGSAYDVGAYEFGGTVSPTASPTTSPTSTPVLTPSSDANGDSKIDGIDYVLFLNNIGKTAALAQSTLGRNIDLNSDGKIDSLDLNIIIGSL